MSDQWRILVVEDEENLNWSIVNSLRKDGYFVQGVMNTAEAILKLRAEGYDVVISDLKMPGADGFELLQWLRMHRPETRLIMVTAFGSASTRTQALEGGVVSYLEKPFDLHTLKEELRRLLQQTGFSANLDSFDLLDVIQIITMSRKSIALLVNTGLEERGVLRFQGGELIWAEYGSLRGEEAFFALAAHKNGVVIHQPWNDQIVPNVTQPLSRLIFQALQYRTKYAATLQQDSSEHVATLSGGHSVMGASSKAPTMGGHEVSALDIPRTSSSVSNVSRFFEGVGRVPAFAMQEEEDDDRPFVYDTEAQEPEEPQNLRLPHPGDSLETKANTANEQRSTGAREWWQQTGWIPRVDSGVGLIPQVPSTQSLSPKQGDQGTVAGEQVTKGDGDAKSLPSSVTKTHDSDLPSWLTDQPTMHSIPALRPSSLSSSEEIPVARAQAEWQLAARAKEQAGVDTSFRVGSTGPQSVVGRNAPSRQPGTGQIDHAATWQPSMPASQQRSESGPLKSLVPPKKTIELPSALGAQEAQKLASVRSGSINQKRTLKRNYSTLISALQTLGYSIPGFVATAVVTLDGHPIAQVAVDDLDISPLYGYLSSMLKAALLSLEHVAWGGYEDTVITTTDRRILLRLVGDDNEAFHILVTAHESDPVESLKMMANVTESIAAALQRE